MSGARPIRSAPAERRSGCRPDWSSSSRGTTTTTPTQTQNQPARFVINALIKPGGGHTSSSPTASTRQTRQLTAKWWTCRSDDLAITRPWLVIGSRSRMKPSIRMRTWWAAGVDDCRIGISTPPRRRSPGGRRRRRGARQSRVQKSFTVKRYDFVVHFCWRAQDAGRASRAAADQRVAAEAEAVELPQAGRHGRCRAASRRPERRFRRRPYGVSFTSNAC